MHGRIKKIKNLLKWRARKHCSILAIDISTAAVKILEISKSEGVLCVEKYGRHPFPCDLPDGSDPNMISPVVNSIKILLEHLQIECKEVVLALPDSAVITNIVQIPIGLNSEEIEELVLIEAAKYFPYPVDEITLDFEIIGRFNKDPTFFDVLIVATRTANVAHRLEIAKQAGLKAVAIDVESYAIERVMQQLLKNLPELSSNQTFALIDLGTNYIHLFILHRFKVIYSRNEEFGDAQLLRAIAEHYQITLSEAVLLKEKWQRSGDYDVKLLDSFKNNLFLQLKRTLQYFYSTHQENFIDHLLLAGGGARLPGLIVLIQEQLAVPVTLVNPLLTMTLGEQVDLNSISNDAPALMVVCGLALRNPE